MATTVKETPLEPGEQTESIQNAEVIGSTKDPLTEAPKMERDHSNTPPPQPDAQGPMPEFATPPVGDEPPIEPDLPPYDELNAQMKDMPPEAQKEAAEFAADMVLGAYGEGKRMLGNKLLLFDTKWIRKMVSKGELNTSVTLPYGPGQSTPVMAAIEGWNASARDKFGLRQGYVDRARPILISEFQKRGIGLSPLMYLAIITAGDLRKDVVLFSGLKAQNDEMLSMWREVSAFVKGGGAQPQTTIVTPPPPPTQPSSQTVTPPPEPTQANDGSGLKTIKDPKDTPPPTPPVFSQQKAPPHTKRNRTQTRPRKRRQTI